MPSVSTLYDICHVLRHTSAYYSSHASKIVCGCTYQGGIACLTTYKLQPQRCKDSPNHWYRVFFFSSLIYNKKRMASVNVLRCLPRREEAYDRSGVHRSCRRDPHARLLSPDTASSQRDNRLYSVHVSVPRDLSCSRASPQSIRESPRTDGLAYSLPHNSRGLVFSSAPWLCHGPRVALGSLYSGCTHSFIPGETGTGSRCISHDRHGPCIRARAEKCTACRADEENARKPRRHHGEEQGPRGAEPGASEAAGRGNLRRYAEGAEPHRLADSRQRRPHFVTDNPDGRCAEDRE